MTLGLPWPILRQGQIWLLGLFHSKKWKLLIFQNIWQPVTWNQIKKRRGASLRSLICWRASWSHDQRWPPRPYMVKTLQKNLLLWIWQADFHETWYVASGTQAHHSLFKWWPWVYLDLFYGQGQIWLLGLFHSKKWKLLIFQNICSLWPETKWKNEHMWVLKVKVISWPWPKVIYIQNLKLAFLRNHWAKQSQILYVSFQVQGNENLLTWCCSHDQDGCPCQYMVKTLQKIFFSGTGWPISMKLGM